MKIRINKRITLLLLLVFICIISIPSALSMYREKQTKTLKATVTHPNYTLTADANGGSIPATAGWTGTGATATKSVTYDSQYGTLPTPTRNGYTFKGWSLLPEGYTQVEYIESSGTQYILTDVVPSSKFKIETDVYISAYGNQPTIAGVSDNNCIQFYYDNTPSVWTKGGSIKDSESYYKQKIHYIAEANSSGLKLDVNGKVYTGPYSYNGGTSNHLMIFAYNINDNAKFPLSGRIYTLKLFDDSELIRNFVPCINNTTGKAGLYDLVTNTFYGNSGTGDFIAGDEEFITSETIVKETSNHTLKATWEAVNYEITYDLQGGTLSAANPATYNIETNTFTLNNPTLTGYTFTGWTGSNGNTPQTTVTIPTGSTGDKAYIANWTANTYTVTADANGGSIPSTTGWTGTGATATKSVTYDSQYGTLPTPTRNGYTFKGWNGKNLLNTYNTSSYTKNGVTGSVTNNGLINISGTTTSSTNYGILAFNWYGLPELEIGKQYTFSISKDLQGLYVQVNYKNTSGREAALISKTTKDKFTFTPPNNYSYLNSYFIGVVKNSENIDETFTVQLEEGTVATAHEPYYVTNTVNVTQAKDHTLKAIWELKDSTLLVGYVFNQKIKKLAGNQDATHETANTNITSIVRSNSLTIMPTDDNVVSTSDSNIPTYAWFDSNTGTLYYYTDAVNIYMNSNSHAMFYNFTNLTNINISDFNTSKVTNMSNLFSNCTHLTSVDLGNFDTSQVTNMNSMFVNASSITTLDLSTFDMSKVTDITNMLLNVTSLKTLKTPSVYPTDSSKKITLPKLMVDGSGNEYTKLDNTSPTETMLYTPATFLQGSQFNIKLKKLANSTLDNITAYTVDTNITGIQRSNTLPSGFVPTSDNTISTSDSYYPIYAWFDNGTIYYYTEALKPYTNENMYHMFYNFDSIETIDLSGISTKKTTNMSAVFTNCNNLHTITLDNNFDSSNVTTMSYMFYNSPITTIDLTKINTSKVTNMSYMFAYTHIANPNLNSFNTSNVEDMSYMFYGNVYSSTMTFGSNFVTSKVSNMEGMFGQCTYLTSLDLSGFNTSNVVNMSKMFYNVSRNTTISLNLNNFNTSKVTNMGQMFFYTQLTSLDISSFDMSLVTDTTSMFTGVNTITELKTPKVYPSEAVIQLPKTLYDPSGNGWSVLDSSAPTETWLHKMVCKRATTLHTETCSQTSDSLYCSGAGYKVGGSKNTSTITYGSLGTNDSTLNGGDAFTCDVNGDGTFNEATERFYYVGDYYNTTTKEFETDTGVLVYYNNVSAGVANNTATSEYDSSGENWHGPVTAITQLPTTSQWTNVSLKNNTRAILTYNNGSMTDGGTLPNDFSYSGYSARLLTVQEINHSLNRSLSSLYSRLDDVAPYLFENTKYSTPTLNFRWWLESVSTNNASAYSVMTTLSNSYDNGIYSYAVAIPTGISVRPAIEVNKNFLNKKVNAYLITYDTNGGSENTTQTVNVGDSLDSLSVPTREGYTFNGWYTAASGGEEVTTATVPTATTTYYAHWTPINYNITYDLDGGEVETANPTTYNPDSNSITLNNPTKTGYTFAGWSGGKNLFDENQITSEIITVEGVVAANSAWRLSDYIPVNSNTNYTFSYVNANSITFNQFKYVLYDENKQYISGEEFANYSTNYSENILTSQNAKYVRIAYSVVVNSENASRSNIQLEEGTTATSYEPYVSNETTLTIPSGSVGNRKYTANWEINKYYLTYDYLDNYSYDGVNALATGYRYDWTKDFKVEATFRIDTLGKRYAIFGNYDDSVNNLNVEVNTTNRIRVYMGAGTYDNYSVQTIPANTDITLTYIWNASTKTYTLTATGTNVDISMNGTVSSMGGDATQNVFVGRDYRDYVFNPITISMFKISTKYDYNTTVTSLPIATKTGYTYSGWYDASTGGNNVISVTIPANDTTVYAHKTPIDYNITYDLDGGTVATNNPSTYNADSNSITLNNPTKTGYTFAGWSGGKNLFNKDATPYYQNSWINESGGRNSEQYYSVYKIPIDENKEYTITHTHTVFHPCYAIFDENDTLLSAEKYSSRKTITFTSPANSKYILVSVITDPTFTPHYDKDIFQLEEGTTATSYEPYVSNETTLTIPSGSVGNRKYIANWTANSYTVTADANGGSIPSTSGWTGTGNTATKSVTYDSQYGTLPTPTRNGYTFKGWNGKNLLNINIAETTKNGLIASVNNNLIRIEGENTNHSDADVLVVQKEDLPQLRNGTRYTLSTYNKSTSESYIQLNYFKENDQTQYPLIRVESGVGTFTVYNDYFKTYAFFIGIKKTVTSIDEEFRIQLEEGTTATPYEPYYVTSSINVTQDKNHTLKAIWEMDTYEIQYDLQGGSLANSNPATYNVETNTFTLNNPTLTGQTFIGWTGSNGNTPEVNVTIPVGSYGDKAYVAHFSPIYDPETRIRSLNTIGTSIADDDPDSNLRYIGSNPNNYVSFNGQKWRIIGVFDGKLKIIQESIGSYSWDTSRNTVSGGYGVNQWGPSGTYTGADLMKLLNPGYSSNTDLKCNSTYSDGNCGTNDDSDYTSDLVNNSLWWNAESGYCYNNANYKTTTCDFTTSGLQSNTARNMIDNATWYLGTPPSSDNCYDGRMTASYLYNMERSNNNGSTTWQGKVGLLYPSDYAYATGGGTTYNRNTCLTVHVGYVANSSISNWDNTYTDCKNNDWLFTSNWTHSISARPIATNNRVFSIYTSGFITDYYASYSENVRPVVYLKSSIKFTTGDGSFNSPFNLIDTE